jgi:hypothetical protein
VEKRWLVVAASAVVLLAALGIVLFLPGGSKKAATSTSTLPITPGAPTATPPAPKLSPISAVFDPAQRATFYVISVRATGQGTPNYSWHLSPPKDNPDCNKFGSIAGAPERAIWHHADSDGCSHTGTQHLGTVTVTVTTRAWECKASFFGTLTHSGSPPQRCRRI